MKRMPKAWGQKHQLKANSNVAPGMVPTNKPQVMCPVTGKPMRIVSQRIVRGDQEHFIPVAVSEEARIVLPLTNEHMEQLGNEYNSHPNGSFYIPTSPQRPKPAAAPEFTNIQWD